MVDLNSSQKPQDVGNKNAIAAGADEFERMSATRKSSIIQTQRAGLQMGRWASSWVASDLEGRVLKL